ncbi:MAG TPA: NAD-dependent epimerase/dehydratase family protein, partial [Clostridia bacterium]
SNMEFDIVFDGSAYHPDQTRIAIDLLKNRTGHFIHLSSASVYIDEIMPYTEDSLRGSSKSWGEYSTNKYNCEEILFREWNENKFPVTILRPFYVYGPGNNLDRESYIFSRLLNDRTIVIPAMGDPVIQFGHIDDLCSAIMMVSQNNKCFGEAYSVSGNEHVSFKDWIEVCAKVLVIEPKLFLTATESTGYKSRDWFPFRDISMFGSCEKIKKDTNFTPKYSIYEGLKQTVEAVGREYFMKCLKISEAEKDILKQTQIFE